MLVCAISQSRAIAERKANSTAFWFIIGSVPGIPQQTGQIELLGEEVVVSTTAQEQNIFDWVDNSTCTSNPISVMNFFKSGIRLCVNHFIIVCKEVYLCCTGIYWLSKHVKTKINKHLIKEVLSQKTGYYIDFINWSIRSRASSIWSKAVA